MMTALERCQRGLIGPCLENRCVRKGTVGSNPTLSAQRDLSRTFGSTETAIIGGLFVIGIYFSFLAGSAYLVRNIMQISKRRTQF